MSFSSFFLLSDEVRQNSSDSLALFLTRNHTCIWPLNRRRKARQLFERFSASEEKKSSPDVTFITQFDWEGFYLDIVFDLLCHICVDGCLSLSTIHAWFFSFFLTYFDFFFHLLHITFPICHTWVDSFCTGLTGFPHTCVVVAVYTQLFCSAEFSSMMYYFNGLFESL